ncbi:uncharacterized protein LOC114841442 [Diachasma alloeum]|uniref:uncharacterized protein LOC114841442 n=1 Tax=Diachasma alloeum TaxID=454923 RepID=UPI0010FAE5E3|nr:uncharacterized protein LOC114841442 [Diachasma alloeum]
MTINEMVDESKGVKNSESQVSQLSSSTKRKRSSNDFLQRTEQRGIDEKHDSHHVHFFKPRDNWEIISLYHLTWSYSGNRDDAQEFLNFCQNSYSFKDCVTVANLTKDQSQSPIWYEMRYGRITASIFDQTAHRHTTGGALFNKIMGGKTIDTGAMARGRELESDVIKVVEDLIGEKILKSGLLLSPQYPWFGASPDGLTRTSIIEVKCPTRTDTVSNYYHNNVVNPNCRAQIELQMLFAGKKKAKFCIADPNFP